VKSTLELLTLGIKELRLLANVLHAENLLAAGLEPAIEKEIQWLSRSDQFDIEFRGSGLPFRIGNPEKELIAFRVVQELINNIIKHANARTIKINFNHESSKVIISINDDGVGFNVNGAIQQSRGLGLRSLFRRAGMIGGELILTSEPLKGTTAILKFDNEVK
jgi:two-component system, NarL family, sensor kinase